MKLAIIGDIEEGKEAGKFRVIKRFIEDQKGGRATILSSGTTRLMHCADKCAKDLGHDSVILGNVVKLAVLNADKVLLLGTPAYTLEMVTEMCKENNKPMMVIK